MKRMKLIYLIIATLLISILIITVSLFVLWNTDYNYFIDRQVFAQMDILNDNVNFRFLSFMNLPKESHETFNASIINHLFENEFEVSSIQDEAFSYLENIREDYPQVSSITYSDYLNRYVSIKYDYSEDKYRMDLKDERTDMVLKSFEGVDLSSRLLGQDPDFDVRYQESYLPFLIGQTPLWSDIEHSDDLKEGAVISTLYPHYDNGDLIAVSTLDINLDQLYDFINVEAQKYASDIILFNRNHELIAHSIDPDADERRRIRSISENDNPLIKSIADLVISSSLSSLDSHTIHLDGKEYLLKFNKLDDVGLEWYSVAILHKDSITDALERRRNKNISIILVVVFLILLINVVIYRRLSKYLKKLRDYTYALSEGEFRETNIETKIFISEFSEFNAAFNFLIENLARNMKALEKSKENYRLIFETSYEGLWNYDVLNNKLDISEKWFSKLGYENIDSSKGMEILKANVPKVDFLNLVFSLDDLSNIDSINEEFRIHNGEGKEFWILSRGQVTERDDKAYPIHITGGFVEITNRKMIEYRLAETLMQIEALYNLSLGMKETLNLDELLNTIVEKLEQIIDYDSVVVETYKDGEFKIIKALGFDQTHSDDLIFSGHMMDVYDINQVIIINDLKKENLFDLENVTSYMRIPLIQNNLLVGAISLFHHEIGFYDEKMNQTLTLFADQVTIAMSNAKLFEAIKKSKEIADLANRAKSDFLANMSHEIRTPMNAVIGYCELLSQTKMTSIQENYLSNLIISSEALLNVLNDILDISKIEEGKFHLENVEFSMDEVLNRVVAVSKSKRKESMDLIVEDDYQVSSLLIGDPVRVQQVLLNLMNNAIKFTDEGYVKLTVIAQEKEDLINYKFLVSDTGIGIAKDKQDSIFEKFIQADSSTTRKFGGSGLGLSITGEIVKQMGGTINLESELNVGTSFLVDISFKKSDKSSRDMLDSLKDIHVFVYKNPEESYAWIRKLDFLDVRVTHDIEDDYDICFVEDKDLDQVISNDKPIILIQNDIRRTYDNKLIKSILTKPFLLTNLRACIRKVMMAHESLPENVDMSVRDKKNVLIVEDNEFNRDIAYNLIARNGVDVDTAYDGENALKKIDNKHYDLIFMDIQMPVLDGIKATKIIREKYDKLNIVALSAFSYIGDDKKVIRDLFDDILMKPINPKKLYDLLNLYLHTSVYSNLKIEKTGDNSVLAALHESDAEVIMRRFNNDLPVYFEMIGDFLKRYKDEFSDFKTYLEEDREEAMKLTHTLRGVTGNLSLNVLNRLLTSIEGDLKDKRQVDTNLCKALRDEYNYINDWYQVNKDDHTKAFEVVEEAFDDILMELLDLSIKNDFILLDAFDKYRGNLGSSDIYEDLKAAMDNLDFEGVTKLIRRRLNNDSNNINH